MKIELLLITSSEGSHCTNEDTFNNLLKSNPAISINNKRLTFTDNNKKLIVKYILIVGNIVEKKQIYFHISMTLDSTSDSTREEDIEQFSGLSRAVRKTLALLNSKDNPTVIDVIWDDISLEFSLRAYPIIYEIENLLRKLIIKFMVLNVGIDWTKTATPENFKISDKIQPFQNIIYEADFIQLSNYLFTPYRTVTINQVDGALKSSLGNKKLDINFLKGFLPKSNWERYFEGKVSYRAEQLKHEWEELYALRNKIAHNRGLTKADFDKLCVLTEAIKIPLNEAISELEKGSIEVTEEQKQEILSEVDINNISLSPNEAKFLKALEDRQKRLEADSRPNSFIGFKHFLSNTLAQQDISEEEGETILNYLSDVGLIEIYKHEDKAGQYNPVSAIRITRKLVL